MEIIIQSDAAHVSAVAARLFLHQLAQRPASVFGLATGSTPLGLYRELIAAQADFSQATTFNLDEYAGLGPEHPQSYAHFMCENLFDQLTRPPARTHIPNGQLDDVPGHCAEYEALIREMGGIDLQLLGLGSNGHIGFNEPSSSLASRTRIKTLTPKTIEDNARFFGDAKHVPRHVITMGIGTILEARHCLVLAFGEKKAQAVAAMAEGSISASCPATILQTHQHCTLIVDEAAASKLQRPEYYRWVYDNKPKWQAK